MKKFAIAMMATAGLALGGLGLAGVAEAQVSDPVAQEAPADVEVQDEGERGDREGRGCNKHETIAEAIGISVEELDAALDSGQSVAEVANANGVSPEAVIDALIDGAEERLEDKVAEGRLTQAEADEKLADKTARIEARVNGEAAEV